MGSESNVWGIYPQLVEAMRPSLRVGKMVTKIGMTACNEITTRDVRMMVVRVPFGPPHRMRSDAVMSMPIGVLLFTTSAAHWLWPKDVFVR
jgi:hypothetical protein